MAKRSKNGLRRLAAPFVVAPPTGASIETRHRLTDSEHELLLGVGEFLGTLYRRDFAALTRVGVVHAEDRKTNRAKRKRELTAASSSRWAGSIVKKADAQLELSKRAAVAEQTMLREAIAAIRKRANAPVGYTTGSTKPYHNINERHQKLKRLNQLQNRLNNVSQRIDTRHPRTVLGGRKLLQTKNNLEAAGKTVDEWRREWDANRLFLRAVGAGGETHGNQTLRVSPEGIVTIKIPTALVSKYGSHYTFENPVLWWHRGDEWCDRVSTNTAVTYEYAFDATRNKWFLSASWTVEETPTPPLTTLHTQRTLGVDVNAGFLTYTVLDPRGNPVGELGTIPMVTAGLSADKSDAVVRHAITTLLKTARANDCASVSIEDLDFVEARAVGRETMGRGARGKTFRRTVANIPTAKFRVRLVGMAFQQDIHIIAVDPAYTSRWSRQHWLTPLQQRSPKNSVTGHHAAAFVIARRAFGLSAKRRMNGSPTRQSTRVETPGANPRRGSANTNPPHVSLDTNTSPSRHPRTTLGPRGPASKL